MRKRKLPEIIPILINKGTVLFPNNDQVRISVDKEIFVKNKNFLKKEKIVGISAVINSNVYSYAQIERVGVAARIDDIYYDGGIFYLFLEPITRIDIISIPNFQESILGQVFYIFNQQNEKKYFNKEKKAFTKIIESFRSTMSANSVKKINHLMNSHHFPRNLDAVADNFIDNPRVRQAMLNSRTIKERLLILNDFLENIVKKTKDNLEKSSKVNNFSNPEIQKKIEDEERKLRQSPDGSSEAEKSRHYLNWLKKIPWDTKTTENKDLQLAAKILKESHFGMEDTISSIIEYLATASQRKSKKGKTLLLVGPPGVGKTSIVKAIAKAMGRKYVRISVGGLKDEATIKGHRRTYVSAIPGKVIAQIAQCGYKNPVFLFDEIDKIDCSRPGNPSDALLELFDPEQNLFFTDNYIDIPFDASEIMFVATANSLDDISKPLVDRMEVIRLSSYTTLEKLTIAKDFILPEILVDYNFSSGIPISDKTLIKIITEYTREAGVRELKRKIEKIISWLITKKILDGKNALDSKSIKIIDILGPPIFSEEKNINLEIGEVNGLAWTNVGGQLLKIQAITTLKRGSIEMTGNLKKVIEESMKLALNLATNYFFQNDSELAKAFFTEKGIQIHAPAGAIPKDGPSAGIAITIALISLLKKIKINNGIAMTGEIDSYGRILPIGGLKEKIIAAHRAGITKVLIPHANLAEINDNKIPQEVKESLEIIGIKNLEEALIHCFD